MSYEFLFSSLKPETYFFQALSFAMLIALSSVPFGGLDENNPLLSYETLAIALICTVSACAYCIDSAKNNTNKKNRLNKLPFIFNPS
jgi:hypothetical protein